MPNVATHINLIALIILLGVVFGLYVSYFLIRKSLENKSPNIFMGFLILSLSLMMFEGWLNYTGYIFKVLILTNYSEPLNFAIAPFVYLFMSTQLGDSRGRKDWFHFIPFVLWLGYCMFFFSQANVFKFNDNIGVMQLDIPLLETNQEYSGDPFRIRHYVNEMTIAHLLIYLSIVTKRLINRAKSLGQTIFKTTNKTLRSLRNSFYHFIIVVVIFIIVKLNFESDVGDYFILLYLSYMIFTTSFQIMNASTYYTEVSTFLEGPVLKYQKSSLEEDNKDEILNAIVQLMKEDKFYLSNTASLSGMAKAINQSSHHVSQVINEKLNQSFFEMLAMYRIEEAKLILKTELGKKLTIEEIAEQVGYNSKSAFNSAFKKFTSQTPSEFRDS